MAYAGDDLPDILCMEEVRKAGGVVVCPADAIPEIKALADYISGCKAGDGAIRDCIHYISQRNIVDMDAQIRNAINWILACDYKGDAYDNDDVNSRYKKLLDEWGMTKVFYD